MNPERRRAVVVLGMHRGGTSAVAGTAIRLGLAGPLNELPPARDNPTGFHESIAVVELNHRLMGTFGCTWNDTLRFEPDELDDAVRTAALDTCPRVLRTEFPEAGPFVLKDPRLCLTLPVWLPALRAACAAISVLLVVRHPEEVARSVLRRDGLPEAGTAAGWLHHMLAAERLSRGLPRAIVFYDDLLRDWRLCLTRASRTANILWPGLGPWAAADVDRFLNPSLRHHAACPNTCAAGPSALSGMIAVTWAVLGGLRDHPASPEARARLDDVNHAFTAWRRQFTGPRPHDVLQGWEPLTRPLEWSSQV